MDQYLLVPFLGGWTSIYQLFWCSPGVQGFDTLPINLHHCSKVWETRSLRCWHHCNLRRMRWTRAVAQHGTATVGAGGLWVTPLLVGHGGKWTEERHGAAEFLSHVIFVEMLIGIEHYANLESVYICRNLLYHIYIYIHDYTLIIIDTYYCYVIFYILYIYYYMSY